MSADDVTARKLAPLAARCLRDDMTRMAQRDMRVIVIVVDDDNRQTQARFECVGCGYENNADVVGAINVLRAGHARFACEVSGAVMPPAAGTHRSDSGAAQCLH